MEKLHSPHLAAMILVAHFGTKAGVLAELRAGQFAQHGDEAGFLLWSTVAGLADRLVDDPRQEPGWDDPAQALDPLGPGGFLGDAEQQRVTCDA